MRPGWVVYIPYVLLATAVSLIVIYMMTRSVDINRHDRIVDLLLGLKQLDVTLDKDILRVKAFRLPDYDTTVDTTARIRSLQRDLRSPELGYFGDISGAFDNKLGKLASDFETKFALLERMKSSNAVLRITLRYLPGAVADFTRQRYRGVNAAVSELLENLLTYNAFPDDSLKTEISAAIMGIRPAAAAPDDREAMDGILKQFRASLKYRDEMSSLMNGYFAVPTLAGIVDLYDSYMGFYADKKRRSDFFRPVLLVISLISFAGLGYALHKLRAARVRAEKARNQLHDAVESISEAFALFDAEDRFVLCNGNYSAYYPMIRDLLVRGAKFEDLFRAALKRSMFAPSDEGEDERVSHRLAERHDLPKSIQQQMADGRWLLCSDSRTQDGGIASVRTDITDLKHAETQLLEAIKDAENANQAKSEFLASMSHELRTPLNAVLGFAQMLQFDPNNPLSPGQSLHVEGIIEGGNHLLDLVNNILELTRIEADQLDISLSEVEAGEVVAECVGMITPLGEPQGIRIVNHFDSASTTPLVTDHIRLKQILINLLSNAVKFNRPGGKVTVVGRETDNGYLRISVTDTGIGIAENDFSRVFKLFHRLDANPMKAREGTGIGLTVTKMLVERMAGRIGINSQYGIGSTFWIELPLASNKDVLIWTNAILTGVDAMDKDHQVLIYLLNRVVRCSAFDGDVDEILHELLDYAQYHFRREEAIMEACSYPDLERHRQLHRELIARAGEYNESWHRERTPENLVRLRKFLKNWMFDHILKEDARIRFSARGKDREIRNALENLD